MELTLYRHHFQDRLSIAAWLSELPKRSISRGKCNLEPAEGRHMGGEKVHIRQLVSISLTQSPLLPPHPFQSVVP